MEDQKDGKDEARQLVEFLQHFDTVGWVTGRNRKNIRCIKKPVPLIVKDFLWKCYYYYYYYYMHLLVFFQDNLGKPVPER